MVARCFDSTGSLAYTDHELKREMSAAPDWMVEHMKSERILCNALECDAASSVSSPSSWKLERDSRSLPHGPEVSYGIPFRWSTSRLLASDMRAMLCSAFLGPDSNIKYHNDTAACDSLLNMSAWTKDSFMHAYTDADLAQLFSSQLRNSPNLTLMPSLQQLHMHMMGLTALTDAYSAGVMQKPDEDALLWDGPSALAWVACNQRNKTCYGKIPNATWYDRAKRPKACLGAFQDQVKAGLVNSTAVGIDICNLNAKTNALCEVCSMLCVVCVKIADTDA